jgi:hypothetical protein
MAIASGAAAMTVKRMTKAGLIESLGTLGTFNPVGHIVLAFADDAAAANAAQALREAGLEAADVLAFDSAELRPAMEALLRASSGAVGFGYEVTLVRRYIDLANEGAGWLVVRAPDDAVAGRVQEIARRFDARAGVRYRRLASEELIEASSKREQL